MKTLILSLLFVSVIGAANCQDYDQKEIQNLRVVVESIKVELNTIDSIIKRMEIPDGAGTTRSKYNNTGPFSDGRAQPDNRPNWYWNFLTGTITLAFFCLVVLVSYKAIKIKLKL